MHIFKAAGHEVIEGIAVEETNVADVVVVVVVVLVVCMVVVVKFSSHKTPIFRKA